MNVCCRAHKQLPPMSGFCRCVAEHCGKARCAETRFPPGAGCQKPDRARQGRGQHYHPHHPAWDLQAMKLCFFQTGASWNTPVWLFSPTIDEFSYGNETPSLLYNAAKKKFFSSLCHVTWPHNACWFYFSCSWWWEEAQRSITNNHIYCIISLCLCNCCCKATNVHRRYFCYRYLKQFWSNTKTVCVFVLTTHVVKINPCIHSKCTCK